MTSFFAKWELECSYTICSDGKFELLCLWNISNFFIFVFGGGNFTLLYFWNVSDLFIFGFCHTYIRRDPFDGFDQFGTGFSNDADFLNHLWQCDKDFDPPATNLPNPVPSPFSWSSSSMLSILPLSSSEIFIGSLFLSKIEQRRLLFLFSSFFFCLLAFFFNNENLLTAMPSSSSVTGLEVVTWVGVASPHLGCLGTSFHYCCLRQRITGIMDDALNSLDFIRSSTSSRMCSIFKLSKLHYSSSPNSTAIAAASTNYLKLVILVTMVKISEELQALVTIVKQLAGRESRRLTLCLKLQLPLHLCHGCLCYCM
ncbi:hypothetical protein DVH24_034087 [Malus domestica]|uniref:Uncharacterized protein n=1 Tax=Malus domestica TaxID=3750 RepID=A0A498KMU3_MALDO|nr:hypothetical protein DVH24_034087 [Malus domestica]